MFQAQNYDPEGEFVAYWLPELRALPREKRPSPGMMYLKPLVALKHGIPRRLVTRKCHLDLEETNLKTIDERDTEIGESISTAANIGY